VCEYLELDTRVEVLNTRFIVLQEFLDLLREHQNNKHMVRLGGWGLVLVCVGRGGDGGARTVCVCVFGGGSCYFKLSCTPYTQHNHHSHPTHPTHTHSTHIHSTTEWVVIYLILVEVVVGLAEVAGLVGWIPEGSKR